MKKDGHLGLFWLIAKTNSNGFFVKTANAKSTFSFFCYLEGVHCMTASEIFSTLLVAIYLYVVHSLKTDKYVYPGPEFKIIPQTLNSNCGNTNFPEPM